jgi:hypothetical protein
MRKNLVFLSVLVGALALPIDLALAADQDRTQEQLQEQEWIYGSQLMTPQERLEHRSRMQAAKSAEEREQIRNEHHQRMMERARERGVTLPDEPPAKGMMMLLVVEWVPVAQAWNRAGCATANLSALKLCTRSMSGVAAKRHLTGLSARAHCR